MNIKSNLRAGMSFQECDYQRNYYKQAYQTGNCSVLNQPANNPGYVTQLPSYQPVGGDFRGVFYPDRSGSCG